MFQETPDEGPRIFSYLTELMSKGSLITRSCRLSNGDIVLWGKAFGHYTPQFHIYNKQANVIKMFEPLCYHGSIYLSSLVIQDNEYLVVSCPICQKIHLYNIYSGEVTKAFSDSKFSPGPMSLNSEGMLCVVDLQAKKELSILLLECNTKQFVLKRIIQTHLAETSTVFDICCVPGLVAISTWDPAGISAVSNTNKTIWELSGVMGNAQCSPYGMAYSQQQNLLVVADGANKRTLIIEPSRGRLVCTVDHTQYVDTALFPHIWADQLILHGEHEVPVEDAGTIRLSSISAYPSFFSVSILVATSFGTNFPILSVQVCKRLRTQSLDLVEILYYDEQLQSMCCQSGSYSKNDS